MKPQPDCTALEYAIALYTYLSLAIAVTYATWITLATLPPVHPLPPLLIR